MLYSEFRNGTGCKDNPHNYEVYKNLEVLYMNSDMTKAQIYEYGMKLVDNSKSPEELEVEAQIKAKIDELTEDIKRYSDNVKLYTEFAKSDDGMGKKFWRDHARFERELVKRTKAERQMWKDMLNF